MNNRTVSGNPTLKNANIQNFDFRYEFYPTPSELISIAAFYKDFTNEGSIIDFLNKYAEISISQNAKKSYKNYDWNLNE